MLFQKWDINVLFDTLGDKLRSAIRGDKERPKPLRTSPDKWEQFPKTTYAQDMQEWAVDRIIESLKELASVDAYKVDRVAAIQAAIGECTVFLDLPATMWEESKERLAGTQEKEDGQ